MRNAHLRKRDLRILKINVNDVYQENLFKIHYECIMQRYSVKYYNIVNWIVILPAKMFYKDIKKLCVFVQI